MSAKVIPFQVNKLSRGISRLVGLFMADRISRATLNQCLADMLPEGEWVDCGSYEVLLTYFEGLPVITFLGKHVSLDGSCPVCGASQGTWLAGEGMVDLWCTRCSCVYTAPEEVLS